MDRQYSGTRQGAHKSLRRERSLGLQGEGADSCVGGGARGGGVASRQSGVWQGSWAQDTS